MRTFCLRHRAAISFAVILAMLFAMMPALSAAAESKHTVAATAPLNLRSQANTSSSVIRTLREGEMLTLLEDSRDGWAHVSAGGQSGYASADYLEIPQGSDVTMTATATEYVYLRAGRGTSYSILTVIPLGEAVPVSDNSDEYWAGVSYGGYTGYSSKMYLTINLKLPAGNTQPTEPAHRSASFADLPQSVLNHTAAEEYPGLILNAARLSLDINETFALTAMTEDGIPVTGGLSYKSSAKGVAAVSSSGLIKAVAKGSATITVTDANSGTNYTCRVTVTENIAPTQPTEPAPTEPPTTVPTEPTQPQPTQPDADALKLNATQATVYSGCSYQLIADTTAAVTWSSSDSSVASVSSDGIVSAKTAGSAVITAKSGGKTAACKITVKSGSSVSLSHSTATISAGKTFLARSYTDGVTWTSSNTKVATVNNGYILARSEGKCVVTVSTSKGAATMLVTVTAAAPVRFAYSSPNCAVKNQAVTLIAITDQKRTGVRFQVTVGGSTVIVNADSSAKDGNTMVWKGTTTFSSPGTYQVKAYSQLDGKWTTCTDAATTAFVSDTNDRTTTVCTARRASDEVIRLIATFEGYISSIYDDPITGDPTVGYGRVIFSGQQFYNTMTKNEAFAYLVQTVNNDGYSSSVNSLFLNNNVRFNQQQFDALVCLVYNTGSGVLSGDSELRGALLDCHDGAGSAVTYYINGTYVRIRKGPGTEYDIIKELEYNTEVVVLSTSNSAWYQVRLADGTVGYVSSDYISKRSTGGNLDLNYVNRQNLIDKFCAYHHAAGDCIRGLLYRRVDEMEMFFYGDYEPCYGDYKYPISYTCKRNPSFHT